MIVKIENDKSSRISSSNRVVPASHIPESAALKPQVAYVIKVT